MSTINLDLIRHDAKRICIAIGDKGSLRWNGLTGKVDIYKVGAKEWQELFSLQHKRDDSYLTEWQDFITCVIEAKSPFVNGEDGFKVLEIIEAARKSSACGGQSVKLIPL